MEPYSGKTLSWTHPAETIELRLHSQPCNEIGSATLSELELFGESLDRTGLTARALVIYSEQPQGFCAGADLRELYLGMQALETTARQDRVRDFLLRIHRVFNQIDAAPLVTVAAVHGVVFGGGFELALTCDMIVADRTARFCFPELRLGLIPGFGGIPRLKRDLGNSLVRDLLMTGRSISAAKAAAVGLVSQLVASGEALRAARGIASQAAKFDRTAATMAKNFIKPIPYGELQEEIRIFCELMGKPAVESALGKFVEDSGPQPYLP
ncbi:MAG: enoyl-CoA hydratase/isomerase family protein [Acidobacteria bacterium]|nr:enoyl-CoA hydratase/isomerase family protein [Acidobacteriota bacterium]